MILYGPRVRINYSWSWKYLENIFEYFFISWKHWKSDLLYVLLSWKYWKLKSPTFSIILEILENGTFSMLSYPGNIGNCFFSPFSGYPGNIGNMSFLDFGIFPKKARAEISRRMHRRMSRDLSYETDSGPKTKTVSDPNFQVTATAAAATATTTSQQFSHLARALDHHAQGPNIPFGVNPSLRSKQRFAGMPLEAIFEFFGEKF